MYSTGPGSDERTMRNIIELTDIFAALLISPIVWLFITRTPVLSAVIFSVLIVAE